MTITFNLTEVTGMIGSLIVVFAFSMTIFKIWMPTDVKYLLMNAIGSGITTWYAIQLNTVPLLVLQITWLTVAVLGLIRHFFVTGLGGDDSIYHNHRE